MSTMLSRSGRSNPDGKLVQRFDIPVSEELNERSVFGELPMARRLARVRGSREWDESPMEGRT